MLPHWADPIIGRPRSALSALLATLPGSIDHRLLADVPELIELENVDVPVSSGQKTQDRLRLAADPGTMILYSFVYPRN